MEPSDAPAHKRTKGRSPSYPGISLKAAVERAQVVLSREGRHAAPIGAITSHWGYKAHTTGPASVTYAALLKFGLLRAEGSGDERLAKLTDLAVEILMHPDPSTALQRAALLPPIHAEMWNEFGNDLPSDENLRYRLVAQRGFTETGFRDFIREYRETVAFARLSSWSRRPESEDVAEAATDEPDIRAERVVETGERPPETTGSATPLAARSSAAALSIPIPVVGGRHITIQGIFPISEPAWANFMAVLAALKPGLVDLPGAVDDVSE